MPIPHVIPASGLVCTYYVSEPNNPSTASILSACDHEGAPLVRELNEDVPGLISTNRANAEVDFKHAGMYDDIPPDGGIPTNTDVATGMHNGGSDSDYTMRDPSFHHSDDAAPEYGRANGMAADVGGMHSSHSGDAHSNRVYPAVTMDAGCVGAIHNEAYTEVDDRYMVINDATRQVPRHAGMYGGDVPPNDGISTSTEVATGMCAQTMRDPSSYHSDDTAPGYGRADGVAADAGEMHSSYSGEVHSGKVYPAVTMGAGCIEVIRGEAYIETDDRYVMVNDSTRQVHSKYRMMIIVKRATTKNGRSCMIP